jgi:hypothetical protein
LCCSGQSRPDGPQTGYEIVILVDSLDAEAIVTAKSLAALSISIHELISILGDTKSEVKLSNCSQPVNFSDGSKTLLALT